MNTLNPETRVAVLARMVKLAPEQCLGRTQVMKLFYFLQELKGVSVGYDFRLFNYGPFDSEVLSDLASACSLAVVTEASIIYTRGYGYAITPGANAEKFDRELEENSPVVAARVDEVVREFGSLGAAELELRSTILFVDREWTQTDTSATERALAQRVREIKPHFAEAVILDRISQMKQKGWLESLRRQSEPATT
jgi:uncharacterized protein